MRAVGNDPSVASLTRNRQHRIEPGRRQSDRPAARRKEDNKPSTAATSRLLVHALRRSLADATGMRLDVQVPTAVGTVQAAAVLESDIRRVALVIGALPGEQEALLLVFGGFDAVYRITGQDAAKSPLEAVALLEDAEPTLFHGAKLARLAVAHSLRRIHEGRMTLTAENWSGALTASIHRRRINRPGEWSVEFEHGLDGPHDRRRAS